MWYLWGGEHSPLFGKQKMASFERYFISDPLTHFEAMSPYYEFRDQESTARRILVEFGLGPENAHIINGHVPVKVNKGENPVKASGKLLVIDGGFSKAYQKKTGIAGYTLISNSYGLLLASHKPFVSTRKAIEAAEEPATIAQAFEADTVQYHVGFDFARRPERAEAWTEAVQSLRTSRPGSGPESRRLDGQFGAAP